MNEIILPVLLFTLVLAITPGPNNTILTASGAGSGYIRSIPYIGGIVSGLAVIMVSAGLGLGIVFERVPSLQIMFKFVGSGYLLYLAGRFLFSKNDGKGTNLSAGGNTPVCQSKSLYNDSHCSLCLYPARRSVYRVADGNFSHLCGRNLFFRIAMGFIWHPARQAP